MRRRRITLGAIGLLVLLAVAVLAGPGRGYVDQAAFRVAEATSRGPAAALTDLDSVGELSAAFNAARGHPRLVLFLSPT